MKSFFCIALSLAVVALACSDRQRRNPLDPQANAPVLDSVGPLEVSAGDGQVQLAWDFSAFDDIEGYKIYKRRVDGEFSLLAGAAFGADIHQYLDDEVVNGVDYEYRLALVIADEGERAVGEVLRATPGPEVAWIADRGSGLVWKINADGRSARFARGRFFDLRDIAVDASNGSCWVSDGASKALFRIDAAGEIERFATALERPDELELDAAAGIGWVSDLERHEVFWFSLAASDTLEFFVVDARLAEPSGLAAFAGACWVIDRQQGRAFLYSTQGRRIVEFRSLQQPAYVDVNSEGSAWVLVAGGSGLVRLDLDGSLLAVELPFADAISLSVDQRNGEVWVLGGKDLALYGRDGELLQQWSDVSGGRGIAFDPVQGRAWIATADALLKVSEEGETLARLLGFSSLSRLEVDPGGR